MTRRRRPRKRAVMISAVHVRARLFHRVRGARRQRLADRQPDPRLVGAALDRGRHRHHHHGPAFPRADADRAVDAGRAADRAEAGRAVGRLCDGAGVRVRLDALHRADPRGDPVGRGRRGDGDQGRGPACGLFRRPRHSVPDRGLHGRAVLVAVCADEAASRQCRARDGRADGHHRHRLSHRQRLHHQHLAARHVPGACRIFGGKALHVPRPQASRSWCRPRRAAENRRWLRRRAGRARCARSAAIRNRAAPAR